MFKEKVDNLRQEIENFLLDSVKSHGSNPNFSDFNYIDVSDSNILISRKKIVNIRCDMVLFDENKYPYHLVQLDLKELAELADSVRNKIQQKEEVA